MKVHFFNPEHDDVLAHESLIPTPSHRVRMLRMNMGYLPSLWADDGDVVIVDDVDYAIKAYARCSLSLPHVLFLSHEDLKRIIADGATITEVLPWGWDRKVIRELEQSGIPSCLMPSATECEQLRQLSARTSQVSVLDGISLPFTVGCVQKAVSCEEVCLLLQKQQGGVVKAPWSSSGRGVRFLSSVPTDAEKAWVSRVINNQGAVTVEPLYDKVMDFAMEFSAEDTGVKYLGLSVFDTLHGAYQGGYIGTENQKKEMLEKYLKIWGSDVLELLSSTLINGLSGYLNKSYNGPLGVDMMIVRHKGKYFVHPCVEINLRRTMGHVALAILTSDYIPVRHMNIVLESNFKLRITTPDVPYVRVY